MEVQRQSVSDGALGRESRQSQKKMSGTGRESGRRGVRWDSEKRCEQLLKNRAHCHQCRRWGECIRKRQRAEKAPKEEK